MKFGPEISELHSDEEIDRTGATSNAVNSIKAWLFIFSEFCFCFLYESSFSRLQLYLNILF